MFKKLLVCAFAAVLPALPGLPAEAGKSAQVTVKKPDAVLAMIAGPVTVRRGSERLAAAFGAQLQAGDVVETGPGGQAGVLFQSGQVIEIGSDSRISIGSLPKPAAAAGGEDTVAQVPDVLAGQLTRFTHTSAGGEGLSALPALRSAGAEPRLEAVAPRQTLVQPGVATFHWTPVPDAIEYRITLTGPGAASGSHRATGDSWTIPNDAAKQLRAGESWTWSIEALTPDGPQKSETYAFEVATEATTKELQALNERLQSLLDSGNEMRLDLARYLIGSYCRSAGLYSDAVAQFEALVSRHPDRAELHRELGSVYQAIGRFDKAAEEYRLALKE